MQRGLQRLAKKWNSRRALRIFRDETGLSTNPHLWSAIETALDESDWFVLLASPDSASSEWVNKEVAHWVATKPVDHILPVVTDGRWEWDATAGDFTADSTAVPPALRGVLRDEARHLDLRWARDETDLDLRNSRFRAAVADLAAPMHGIAKDELEGEDIRQHRRARRLARGTVATLAVLLVVALIATGVAVNKSNQANRERNQADKNAAEALTRGLATEAGSLLQRKRLDEALLVAAQAEQTATRDGIRGDAGQLASTALLQTLTASPSVAGFLDDQPSTATSMDYSPDGAYFVSMTDGGEIRAWNAKTDQELLPPRVHGMGGDSTAGLAVNRAGILAAPSPSGVALWDLTNNAPFGWQPPAAAKRASTIAGSSSTAAYTAVSDGGLVAEAYGDGPTTLDVWDLSHRRRVGTQLTFPGLPHGIAFSSDGTQLAVTIDDASSSLAIQLVNVPTATLGLRLDAQQGPFNAVIDAFQSPVVFSRDGHQVSSIASRGPWEGRGLTTTNVTKQSAIETFDTRTGARIPGPAVAVGQELVGVSSDLREIATLSSTDATHSAVTVVDARSGAQLVQIPVPGLAFTFPVAFAPTRSNMVIQSGPDVLAVTDWTEAGAPHFARATVNRISPVELAANGTTIDLTPALHRLGLSTRCFAPLASNCDYTIDAPTGILPQRTPLVTDNPRRPWTATAGPGGDVAILAGRQIVIWNTINDGVERRLTGVPAKCDDLASVALVFVGTAQHGRVALGCTPSLVSWDLRSSGSTPAWSSRWAGPSFNYNPTPVVISPDNATIAVTVLGATEFLDAHTGHLRARGPLVTIDNNTGGAYSADGRTYAQLSWSGTLTLIDPSTGKAERTLTSSRGNLADLGIICADCGSSGNPPAVVFSPDGSLVAVWHDSIGMEIWNVATGESLAVLGGQNTQPLGTLTTLQGTGTLDALFRHRLTATYPSPGTLQTSDIHDVVRVTNGVPTNDYTSLFRAVTWSMRPGDWVVAACDVARRDLTAAEWKSLVSSTAPYQHTCTPLLTNTSQHG